MKPYQKLQHYWRETRADISTIAPGQQAVDRLEQTYGIRLPNDFRDYLLHCCPRDDDWGVRPDLTTWWGLDNIKSITEDYKSKIADETIARDAGKYLFFADYLIWSCAWAIACGDDENHGRVVVISGDDRFVADSFAQFVGRFIDDQRQLL